MYAAGRLDADSEGLLVLTDVPWVKARLTDPAQATPKTYLVQVELPDGVTAVDDAAHLAPLRTGVTLADGPTRPAKVRTVAAGLPDRYPPVHPRAGRATAWLEMTITEGRNRQVRRMTAAVGLSTLRLVRIAVGPWRLEGLAPRAVRRVEGIPAALFGRAPRAAATTRGAAPAKPPSGRTGRSRPPRR